MAHQDNLTSGEVGCKDAIKWEKQPRFHTSVSMRLLVRTGEGRNAVSYSRTSCTRDHSDYVKNPKTCINTIVLTKQLEDRWRHCFWF